MFQFNHKIAPDMAQVNPAKAVVLSAGLSTGFISMLTFGTCWILDISTFSEFGAKMRAVLQIFPKHPIPDSLEDNEATDELTKQLKHIFSSKPES